MKIGIQVQRIARYFLFASLALFASASAWGAIFVVANNNDSGAGSLRGAIASSSAGDMVTFTVTGTITLTSGAIAIPHNLSISGPGADVLQVSGNSSNQIFSVAAGVTTGISGLSLTSGNVGAGGQGGAIYSLGVLTLDGVTISASSAGDSGGGIYNGGTLAISDSTLNGNSVGDVSCAGGGAIRSEGAGSSLIIVNSTITGNTASNCSGGGISFSDGSATIVSSTIDANTAGLSGGNVYKGSAVTALTLRNTIIAAGVTGGGTPANPDLHGAVGGGMTSLGYNLVQTQGDSTGYIASDLANGTDPDLGALASNGGSTETQLAISPAVVDAIPLASCLDSNGSPLATDQRGVARPQNGLCDIGAVELAESLFTASVTGSGTVSASGSPISGGINACNSSGGSNCSAVYSKAPAGTVVFTATPSAGYSFTSWGGDCSGNTTCSLQTDQPHNVTATFTINTYMLTYLAGANGTISGAASQTVTFGASGTPVTAVPATNYHFVQWSDGSTANPRTDANVSANISVTASFAINTYTLTYTAGANGTIGGTTPQTVNYGASGTPVTAVPATNYHFVQWSDGSTTNPRTDANVTANISVTASFAQILPPVATAQSVNVAFNMPTPITLAAVDSNPGGPFTYTFAIATAPANGSVTISGATATYTPAAGYVGPDSFTFTATDVNGTSAPATVTITVAKDQTSTVLAASPNPSTLGQTITFTVTVLGDPPTGTVVFLDGSTPIGTMTLDGTGQAVFSISSLSAGTHSITAAYSGDAINTGSVSTALLVVVGGNAPVAVPMLDWLGLCLLALLIGIAAFGSLRVVGAYRK